MKTCPPQDKLRQLLSEELQETDRDGFDRHVAECATCQSVLDGLTDDTLSTELSTIDRVAVSVDREPALDALLVRLKQQHVDEFARRIEADAQPSEPEEIRFPGPATPDAPLGQLGQYQILEELGSGATGCLFKARDTKLGRFVAVKVLKQELAALKSARERFNREARAAAALDHDNIVTIHEVGDTPGFPPYLVLECIAGESLHQRLERQRVLQPRAAAEIAEQIARGLAAAHDCGVIHRDVKPSNIMLEQATGRAKITDFGLARIPESAAGLTVEGTIAGTPVYMSPEQIIHPQEVDGQTDVYSIGVILYELLTGVLPFRGVMRMVLTQVLNDDPQPPRRLNDSIPRDLETICLKAMSKEASQRYATAADLADDLSRWLEGKPVLARPIGSLGRLVRWTKRSPWAAGCVALSFAGVIGLGSFTYSLNISRNRERAAREKAVANEELADRNLDLAKLQTNVALRSLGAMIHEVQNRLEGVSEMQDLRQTLLNIADRGVTDVHDAVKDSGLATLYTATTQNRMGDLSKELGNFNQAKLHYEKALEIARGLANDHPRHNDVKQSLAFSLWSLGDISIMSGQHAQAERRYREALRLSQEVVAADRSNTGARRSLSIAYDRMGDVFRDNGRFREAVGYFQKAIGEARNLAKQLPDDKELKRDLAVICLKLGSVNLKLKKPDQAEEYYRQGHMLCLDLASANRDSVRAKRDLAISYARLAERAQHVGDARQALDLLLRSHQIYSSLAKKDPRNAILKRDLAISYTNLGQVDLKLDEIEEARIYFEEAIRSWEELTRSPSAPFQDRQGLVLAQKRLAIAELRAGLDAQAQDRLILIRDLLEELGDEKVVATNAAFRKWLDRQQRDLRSLEQDGALTQ